MIDQSHEWKNEESFRQKMVFEAERAGRQRNAGLLLLILIVALLLIEALAG